MTTVNMKQVSVFLGFLLLLIALPGRVVAQERTSQESIQVLDTIQNARSVQNQQTMDVLQQQNAETSRTAADAKATKKRADAVAKESDKALRMEKKAQKLRKQADKQAAKAINAQNNY
jgi:hypothetical protein